MTVYILGGKRTPIGSLLGTLSAVPAPQLAAVAIKEVWEPLGKPPVEELYMGNVVQAGVGQAPARQAALFAGLPEDTPCVTVNKVCGSGLQSLIFAAQSIEGQGKNCVVAGGMENMSLAPHLLYARQGHKFGPSELKDSMQWDGLWDVYSDRPMGNCAEECAQKYGFTREAQDEFAIESFKKSQQASQRGIFAKEIAPVMVRGARGEVQVSEDEGPFKAKFDKIPLLKPAFSREGTITAANASTINDGAAALVLAGEQYRDQAEFKIVSYAGHAQNPTWFTTAPVEAMKKCLAQTKLDFSDIDLFEINEAFAVVTMAAIKECQLPAERVNVFGGAISLGHPIGCSGARIVVTLMNALKEKGLKRGMASLCIGGGEALAMIIERI